MIKACFFIFIGSFVFQNSIAQSTYKRNADSIEILKENFIYTYNNELINYKSIEFVKPSFAKSYLKTDSSIVMADTIKFFKNANGFYANIRKVDFYGEIDFVERIESGKVNYYETNSALYNTMITNPNNGMMTYGSTRKKINNYYNFGFDEIKKATFLNMSIDFVNNAESMQHLYKFKRTQRAQTILLSVGGVMFLGGLFATINASNGGGKSNIANNFKIIGVGVGIGFVSYLVSLSKPAHLRNAILSYNK